MSSEVLSVAELLRAITRTMVDHPEKVIVREVQGKHACVLELEVAKKDIGKIIGRKGVHADAIRKIIHAAGGRVKKRYVIEIIEQK